MVRVMLRLLAHIYQLPILRMMNGMALAHMYLLPCVVNNTDERDMSME